LIMDIKFQLNMPRRKKQLKNKFTEQIAKVCSGAYKTMIQAQAAPHFESSIKGRAIMAYVQCRG
jgi:hypothetical protein